jgi:ribonucleoside-diphosphate reductase alpha chain
MTNISVILDDEFFTAFDDPSHEQHELSHTIYDSVVRRMLKTAEPGFSVDTGDNSGETLRNACTEVTSSDDSDICNLGSINMARIDSLDEFKEAVRLGTLFLLAGTVYSHLPYEQVADTRAKNRRLGLGLMGIHEWLLKRGYGYEPNRELQTWLEEYAKSTELAHAWADEHGLSRPVKTRAIAPTGTIGIIAETTTGIEPIFCVAYKRRYLADGKDWKFQYVIDPTAKRLIEDYQIEPEKIEDAYSLAYDVERRVAMQAFVQRYVDHGISSTINLPYVYEDEAEIEDFGKMLIDYLPGLRGITCYPDGARGGQPLTAVGYQVAAGQEGVVFEEVEERCVGGSCGI